MSQEELYEATRGWWRLARHKGPRAQYALAVSNSLVRGAYRIDLWAGSCARGQRLDGRSAGRPAARVSGQPGPGIGHLLNTSVARYFKPGQQGLRYVNCDDERLAARPVVRGQRAAALAREEGVEPGIPLMATGMEEGAPAE